MEARLCACAAGPNSSSPPFPRPSAASYSSQHLPAAPHRTAPPSSKIPPIQDKRLLFELLSHLGFSCTPSSHLCHQRPTTAAPFLDDAAAAAAERNLPPGCIALPVTAALSGPTPLLLSEIGRASTHAHTQTHGIRGSCFFRPSGLRCPFLGSPASHSMCPVVPQPTSSGR